MTTNHLRRVAPVLLCALALAAGASAKEGDLRFEHITMDQGLSHVFVHAILKDSRGFLWFGTAEGLNRYDGGTPIKTIYKHDPLDPESLPGTVAGAIFEDSKKRLWVGSGWVEGGIALFDRDRERFRRIPADPGGGNQARCFMEDRQGRIWVGTNNGLVSVDPDKLTITRHPLGPQETSAAASKIVPAIHEDRQGRFWVGTGAGLLLFDRSTGQYTTWARGSDDATGLASAAIWDFYEQEDGGLWIATKSGLHRLDTSSGQDTRYLPDPNDASSISSARVTRLAAGRQGQLYVGTENGLNILDLRTRKFTRYALVLEDDAALNSSSVWSLCLDDQGILWIGTVDGGVNYLSPLGQRFVHIRGRRGELADPNVTSVMEDHLGNLWIGTATALNRLDQRTGAFTYYRDIAGAFTLMEDRERKLWFGGWDKGAGVLDPTTGRTTRFRHDPSRATSIASDNVWRVVELSTGEMLVVLADGLDLYDRKTGTFSRFRDRYPDAAINPVFSAAEDRDHNLWVVGAGVLFVDRKTGKCRLYKGDPKDPNGVPEGELHAVYVDSAGNVWIGGMGGLTCVSAGTRRMRRFTTKDGLPSNWVNNMLEDAGGNLWVTTTNGLSKFVDALKLPEKPQFVSFTALDGLQGYRFVRNASFRGTGGRLYFGGPRGLNSFVPERVVENRVPPPIAITGLKLSDKPQKVGAPGSRLTKPLYEIEELTLSYRDTIVTFEFAALNYLLPQKNRYKFRLDPFDEDWRDPGSQRFATYTNLDPGRCTFQVLGINNDGVPSEKPATLRIRITPHPLWSPWAKTFYVLLLVGSVIGTIRWRVRAIEARRRELEILVEQRTTDLQTEVAQHKATEARLADEVTERRRAEEEAQEYAKKLASSNVELIEGQRALEQKQQIVERENAERRRAEEEARQASEQLAEGNRALTEKQRQLLEQQEALARENEERRRAEVEAGRERDLLHALMDNIPDLIYFKDPDGRYTRINRAHAAALGLTDPEQAAGRSDADFFAPEYAQAAHDDERQLIATGQPLLGKLEHETRSGRWYLATKVPIRDASGAASGLVGISKDITERRRVEEQLKAQLAAFQRFVSAVAEGDLSQRGIEGEDTLGKIAIAVNRMLEGFTQILTEVRDASFSVSTASTQILAASTEIAKGAQFERDQVHGTSSTVSELVASMAQVSKNAEESARAAQQVLEHVKQSDQAVDVSGQGMSRIDAAVAETAEKMRLLGARSQEIFEIIDLIEDIAGRSELLSLNAAIEAAHAGAAGHGFAVVADEVRHLAERSTEATRSVTAIVRGMAAETQAALQAMETSTREVNRGLELSEQARQGLREISALVRQAAELTQLISMAVHEQTEATRTVDVAMHSIANIAEESTAGSTETARAVRDLVSLAEHLTRAVARFRIDAPENIGAPADGSEATRAMVDLARQMGRVADQLEAGDKQTPASKGELGVLVKSMQALLTRLSHSTGK
jgi:PAS domain S-box-containing protein